MAGRAGKCNEPKEAVVCTNKRGETKTGSHQDPSAEKSNRLGLAAALCKVIRTPVALESCPEDTKVEEEGTRTARFEKTGNQIKFDHMRRMRASKSEFAPPRRETLDWRRDSVHDSRIGNGRRGKEVERSNRAVKWNEASNVKFSQKLKTIFGYLFSKPRHI